MSKENLIKRFIEQRKLQAIQRQLTEKLGRIARVLGDEISSHREDPILDIGLIPDTMDEMVGFTYGYMYDGYHSGMQFEIVGYTGDDGQFYELKATYKGDVVYHIEDGVLQCYCPLPQWEKFVDSMDKVAKDKEFKRANDGRDYRTSEKVTKHNYILHILKKTWGIEF